MLQIPHLLICWIFRFCFILLDKCVISSLCVSCDLNFSFRVVRRFLQNGCLCVIHLNISIMNFNLIDKVFRRIHYLFTDYFICYKYFQTFRIEQGRKQGLFCSFFHNHRSIRFDIEVTSRGRHRSTRHLCYKHCIIDSN